MEVPAAFSPPNSEGFKSASVFVTEEGASSGVQER
jgi:hypothetical protein